MPGKKVTIESLARIIKIGFDETAKRVDVEELKKDIKDIKVRLGNIEDKLEGMGKLTWQQYNEQIKSLEKRMNRLEEMFAVK